MALTDQKDAAAEGMMEKLVQVNRVAKTVNGNTKGHGSSAA
jgi:small subunit ribosomal protein S5